QQLLSKRTDMTRNGGIDWAMAELMAIGSLLVEGKPVRLAGQDARRGTFVQRQAVFHDRVNGQEWLPLANLTEDQGWRIEIRKYPRLTEIGSWRTESQVGAHVPGPDG
ncbi:family 20 glycosylhydrolase, partial [Bacillus sp. S34]|nr:family 20 glycosylhydrolase [Bacillus sp. S34]